MIMAYWITLWYIISHYFTVNNKLQEVVTNKQKYDIGLHHAMKCDLHWLDMTSHLLQIAKIVYCYLHGIVLGYLSELYVHLASYYTETSLLSIKLSTNGAWWFTVASWTIWTSLLNYFRDPILSCLRCFCLLCFDTVGWVAGRASGL